MKIRAAFRAASAAVRANLLPGLLLQVLMGGFIGLYVAHDGTRRVLAEVARTKQEAGYLFAFLSYVAAAALLPEILRIVFFQSGKPSCRNIRSFLTSAPAWGAVGVAVDFLYRCQGVWFGTGNDWWTIFLKLMVDQFLVSPFLLNPVITGWFVLRDARFHRDALARIFCWEFFFERVFPIQVAAWTIWLPGVALIYFMPPPLQLPVAVIIECLWVLIFTTLGERLAKKQPQSKIDGRFDGVPL